MLLGKKVCIVLFDYQQDFFNARYSSDSFSCRRARVNTGEFLKYVAKIRSVDEGFPQLSKTIADTQDKLIEAQYALTTRANAIMEDLFESA